MASDRGSITYKPYRHWPGPEQEPLDMASIFRPDIWEAARAWQAFMQWCDGTAEQWSHENLVMYQGGFAAGYRAAFSRYTGSKK